jgi:hypothetical protein
MAEAERLPVAEGKPKGEGDAETLMEPLAEALELFDSKARPLPDRLAGTQGVGLLLA